jgi:glutamine synthetase
MSAEAALKFAAEHGVEFVDVRFTDLLGQWHHLTIPIDEFGPDAFENGVGFDASSLRGWAAINESDMLLIPDSSRYWIDPFMKPATLCLISSVFDPITKDGYWLDPRAVAQRAQNYLRFTGLGDVVYFGPEAEFFIFDKVSFHNEGHTSGYAVDSMEGPWNTSSERGGSNGHGYHIRPKEGYVPLPPLDSISNLRSEIATLLRQAGIPVECHHHEVATGGQCEIDFRYNTLLTTADNLMVFKYTVKNAAMSAGKAATFMPKPIFGDNGNGMHCHQSIWKDGKPLFAGDGSPESQKWRSITLVGC